MSRWLRETFQRGSERDCGLTGAHAWDVDRTAGVVRNSFEGEFQNRVFDREPLPRGERGLGAESGAQRGSGRELAPNHGLTHLEPDAVAEMERGGRVGEVGRIGGVAQEPLGDRVPEIDRNEGIAQTRERFADRELAGAGPEFEIEASLKRNVARATKRGLGPLDSVRIRDVNPETVAEGELLKRAHPGRQPVGEGEEGLRRSVPGELNIEAGGDGRGGYRDGRLLGPGEPGRRRGARRKPRPSQRSESRRPWRS